MQRYQNNFSKAQGNSLRPVAGASVLVTTIGGAVATIYSDNGVTTTTNPLTTDANGMFAFYAADGRYSLTITSSETATVVVSDILLEDPQDGSPMVINSGTISNSALSNVTIDGVAVAGSDIAKYSRLNDADGADLIGFSYAVSYAAGTIGKWLKDLATSVGSTLVGFIQSGTGATLRTVQDKLRETVSVKDFGAVGDGVADDTAAIQAALDAAASGGNVLHFPGGVYSVTGGLTGPRNLCVTGDGWQTTIKLANGANATHIIKFGDETATTTVELHDIEFDGNKANNPTAGDGLVIVRGYKANLFNVRATNCKGDGIQYEANASSFENYLYGVSSYANDGVGVRMTGAGITDTHIVGGDIGFNATAGAVLATSCSVVGATIWGAGLGNAIGIITAGSSWQIQNCKIEGHGQHGIKVSSGNHHGLISGNKIYANSFNAVTSGLYDGIYVEAGADYGTITGNKVYSSLSAVDTYLMRYAINFAGAHNTWTIGANELPNLGVQGVPVTTAVVNGLLETDKFDGNWIRTSVKSRRSANVNATAAFVWTLFPYDTDDSDVLGEFSGGTFTPKSSGRYQIEAAYTCTAAAAGENLGLALYTNAGTAIRRIAFIRSVGTSSEMVSGCIDEFLTAGTAYDIRYLVGSTSTQFLAGAEFTYVRIRAIQN